MFIIMFFQFRGFNQVDHLVHFVGYILIIITYSYYCSFNQVSHPSFLEREALVPSHQVYSNGKCSPVEGEEISSRISLNNGLDDELLDHFG